MAPAIAGQYDYTLTIAAFGTDTRGVPHDYSYLRFKTTYNVHVAGLKRAGGDWFIASGTYAKSYVDPCNPATCLSYYYNGAAGTRTLDIHDEWR